MTSLETLIAQLAAPVQEMRDKARQQLVAAGEAALPLLLAGLTSPNRDVRGGSALALGELGGDEAIGPLAAMANDDDDSSLRPIAVRALSDIAAPAASSELIIALIDQLKSADKFSRALACRGLGRIGGAHCRQALELASRDRDDWVRQAAQEALVAADTPASAASQPDDSALTDSGAPSTGLVPAGDALATLVGRLTSLDLESQRQAQQALVDHGDAAVAKVAPLLWDPIFTTRRAAAETLGLIGGASAGPPLARCLAQPETPKDLCAVLMHAIARVLAGGHTPLDELPLERIEDFCADADAHVRSAALAVALRLEELRALALDWLVEEEDDDWVVGRALAVLALAVGGNDRRLLGRLVDALGRHVEPDEQLAVLTAIHRIVRAQPNPAEDQQLVGPTSYFLRSDQAEVRLTALELLALTCEDLDPATLQDLLGVLAELPPEANEQRGLALMLVDRAAPRGSALAAEGLRPLLDHPDAELAKKAAEVLGGLGGGAAVDALIEVANSQRGPVVAAAAQALARLDQKAQIIAVRGPDGRWIRKLQLHCLACETLLGWTVRHGREELRCPACEREHVLGPTGKLYDAARTPLGTCLCCPRKQLLIRQGDGEAIVCPERGSVHVRPYDALDQLQLLADLPLGACGCCPEPQPLEQIDDGVVCHRTRREHLPTRGGFAPAAPRVDVADDVAAINEALLDGTLGIGQSGLPSVDRSDEDE